MVRPFPERYESGARSQPTPIRKSISPTQFCSYLYKLGLLPVFASACVLLSLLPLLVAARPGNEFTWMSRFSFSNSPLPRRHSTAIAKPSIISPSEMTTGKKNIQHLLECGKAVWHFLASALSCRSDADTKPVGSLPDTRLARLGNSAD